MKLVFPSGEHPQVVLQPGVNRIGSAPDAHIVLALPGVHPLHAQLHVTANGVMLDVQNGARVSVNGSQVSGLIALRDGDRLAFDDCEAQLAAMENVAMARPGAKAAASNDDLFATAVRQALPKFVLRGVSGKFFGRTFALSSVTTVGRSPDCTLRLDEAGISRSHARLLPSEDGVQFEDLGSTNGTFLNGKRVLHGVARVGDEIGFDTLRFQLASTTHSGDAHTSEPPPRTPLDPRLAWGVAIGAALIAGAILLAL
ncbi:FHA domain-containing protein [Lysobacter sp. N42]|uniref:FHA domain-containing protein n=1 Tax=Lysobacter sp. N42 TaxID=2545719 RepID=UPI0010449F21|nr:FHA domain-containing protein [Lysobacter sp. N42]TCZ88644.1 FHA domain-containing protein [Lysobacter sp. N42]